MACKDCQEHEESPHNQMLLESKSGQAVVLYGQDVVCHLGAQVTTRQHAHRKETQSGAPPDVNSCECEKPFLFWCEYMRDPTGDHGYLAPVCYPTHVVPMRGKPMKPRDTLVLQLPRKSHEKVSRLRSRRAPHRGARYARPSDASGRRRVDSGVRRARRV